MFAVAFRPYNAGEEHFQHGASSRGHRVFDRFHTRTCPRTYGPLGGVIAGEAPFEFGIVYRPNIFPSSVRRGRVTHRILVPLDDSDPSWAALEDALRLFESQDIVVLHVIEMDELTHVGGSTVTDDLLDARKDEAEELFDRAQAKADEYGVSLERAIETGNPDEVIVEAAESGDVDHVVMGTHGRSGLSGILVGSVAQNVVQNAPVRVTISRGESATGG